MTKNSFHCNLILLSLSISCCCVCVFITIIRITTFNLRNVYMYALHSCVWEFPVNNLLARTVCWVVAVSQKCKLPAPTHLLALSVLLSSLQWMNTSVIHSSFPLSNIFHVFQASNDSFLTILVSVSLPFAFSFSHPLFTFLFVLFLFNYFRFCFFLLHFLIQMHTLHNVLFFFLFLSFIQHSSPNSINLSFIYIHLVDLVISNISRL